MFHSKVITLGFYGGGVRALVSSGRRVLKWGSMPLENGAVVGGVIVRPDEVAKAVGALKSTLGVQTGRAVAAITGLRSMYRFITIPRMPAALLAKAVRRDAENEMHVPAEDLYLAWRTVAVRRDEQDIFVVGVPRGVIDGHLSTLRQAGFSSIVLDCRPLALARAVGRRNAIVADMEPDGLHLVVVKDGLPRIMRSISVEDGGSVGLARLQEEFDTTLRLYDNTYGDEPLAAGIDVTLTGSLAPAEDSLNTVADALRFPVRPVSAPLKCPTDMPVREFALNMGLCLKAIGAVAQPGDARIPDVDLLAETRRRRRRPPKDLVLVPVALAGVAVAAGLFQVYDEARARSYQAEVELQDLGRQVAARQAEAKKIAEAEQALALNRSVLQALEKDRALLLPPNVRYHSVLYLVGSEALSGDINIASVKQEGAKVTVTGAALNQRSVLAYARRLEQSTAFSSVDVVSMLNTQVGTTEGPTPYKFKVDDVETLPVKGDVVVLFTVTATR